MVDVALIKVSAGNGGNGAVSFYRAKYILKGGPDGGDGGHGGHVYLVGERNLRTLDYFAGRQKFEAKHGERGGANRRTGVTADHLKILVPQGTVVYQIDMDNDTIPSRSMLYDLLRINKEQFDGTNNQEANNKQFQNSKLTKLGEVLEDMDELLVARGGGGGKGNDAFKSPTNTTPMTAQEGGKGEVKWLVLELKLLADIGLVGLPNAGKSTILSVLTNAKPKIANYEFTTLEPNLGVMKIGDVSSKGSKSNRGNTGTGRELVIADIPGLIEGASEGKGLGDEFLRHIERCKALIHVVGIKLEALTNNEDLKSKNHGVAEELLKDYLTIRKELGEYHPDMLKKPEIVVVNKVDLVEQAESTKLKVQISKLFKENGVNEVLFVSAATREGVDMLAEKLVD